MNTNLTRGERIQLATAIARATRGVGDGMYVIINDDGEFQANEKLMDGDFVVLDPRDQLVLETHHAR